MHRILGHLFDLYPLERTSASYQRVFGPDVLENVGILGSMYYHVRSLSYCRIHWRMKTFCGTSLNVAAVHAWSNVVRRHPHGALTHWFHSIATLGLPFTSMHLLSFPVSSTRHLHFYVYGSPSSWYLRPFPAPTIHADMYRLAGARE